MADTVIPAPVPSQSNARRPKVWLLADQRGWAYDELCQGLAATIVDEFDCRTAYVAEQPDLAAWDFDLIVVCFWGETYHQSFVQGPRQVIKLLCSHRWQEPSYGCLTPPEFAAGHLSDAHTIGATSERLQNLVSQSRSVLHTPEGVDVERFAKHRTVPPHGSKLTSEQTKPLTFGWAGNIEDACKGVADVLLPAAEGFDLRLAKGDLDAKAMRAFYQDLDVIVVASSLEGQPRPLLEGMASACYAISTDVGIARELIRDGDNGRIVRRSIAAVRAAMHWCQCNATHVRQQGAQNATQMRQTRTWSAVAPAWRNLLRTAMLATTEHPAAHRADAQHSSTSKSTLIERCKQDYAVHLDAVHHDGPDDNSVAAAAAYYRNELLPLLPSSREVRALDVGCAYGLLLEFLHNNGYRNLAGIEIDANLQQRAQQRLQGKAIIHRGDANVWLAEHEGAFDVITAYDILEHFPLEGAAQFATSIRKALRPGGIAIFRTPNMANVLGIYSRYMDLTHQIGFTEQSASQLLRQCGFAETQLLVPDFSGEEQMAAAVQESRRFHQQMFALQDRSTPLCFDKNLVIAARALTTANQTPTQPAGPEVAR